MQIQVDEDLRDWKKMAYPSVPLAYTRLLWELSGMDVYREKVMVNSNRTISAAIYTFLLENIADGDKRLLRQMLQGALHNAELEKNKKGVTNGAA